MINPYRPVPLAPPPPPPAAPLPLPLPGAFVPPAPRPVASAWGQPQVQTWDPLGELAATAAGTPLGAFVGAGLGFMIAGPVGAARGAMLGAALPGVVCAAYEFHMTNRWWGKQPNRSGLDFQAILLAFPALSAIGFGIGMAIGGPVGAAWGTLIAAALPAATAFAYGTIGRWLRPPVYMPPDVAPTVR